MLGLSALRCTSALLTAVQDRQRKGEALAALEIFDFIARGLEAGSSFTEALSDLSDAEAKSQQVALVGDQ